MAAPDIVKGAYIDILLGNGDTVPGPETFTPVCGLTARTLTEQVNTNDVFVPDCDDPEMVPVRRLVPTGQQWDISGEGLLNLANRAVVRAAKGITSNWRFVVGRPAGSIIGAGYYEGPAMLTNLQIGGSAGNGEFATTSLTIASDGAWTWTDAVAP